RPGPMTRPTTIDPVRHWHADCDRAVMHQLPTLVYAAVLGPDLASDADLARLILGALLWIALVVLNRGAAGASAIPRGTRNPVRNEHPSRSRALGAHPGRLESRSSSVGLGKPDRARRAAHGESPGRPSPTFAAAPAAQQAGDGSVQGRRERAAVRRD